MHKKAVSLFTLMFFSAGLIFCACLQASVPQAALPSLEEAPAHSHCHEESEAASSAPAPQQKDACCAHCETEKGFILPAQTAQDMTALQSWFFTAQILWLKPAAQTRSGIDVFPDQRAGPPGAFSVKHHLSATPLYLALRTLLI